MFIDKRLNLAAQDIVDVDGDVGGEGEGVADCISCVEGVGVVYE